MGLITNTTYSTINVSECLGLNPSSVIGANTNSMLCNELKTLSSVVVQSMATLAIMSGIFLIFRLEYISQRFTHSMNAFRKWTNAHLRGQADPDFETWLEKDVLFHILKAYEDNKDKYSRFIPAILDYFTEIN
jgi:hypothetical protein